MSTETARDNSEGDADEKPPGFDVIYQNIGEDRKRLLRYLANRDEESPATSADLSSPEGANIPRGSVNHHLDWLQGNITKWWPDEAEPLVEIVGRVQTPGGGHPTKEVALTEYGERFVEAMDDGGVVDADSNFAALRDAVRAQSQQLNDVSERLEKMEQDLYEMSEEMGEAASPSEESLDQIETLSEQIQQNEAAIKELESARDLEQQMIEVVEHVGRLQEHLGIDPEDLRESE